MAYVMRILAAILFLATFAASPLKAADKNDALTDMTMGAADAPIQLIEYGSVTCSHCAEWSHSDFPSIKAAYIDPGKVKFTLREFPLAPPNKALIARSYVGSMMARCAAEKGGPDYFFEVIETLFAKQQEWAFGADPRGELLKIGADAGLTEADFDACIQREDIKKFIDDNVTTGIDAFKVSGTPTFVLKYGDEEKVVKVPELPAALEEAVAATQ